MIVPRFWSEAEVQSRQGGRSVTVRRFGWSNEGEADAQAQAEARAAEALQRILAGEKLRRREPRVGYNGAEGVPIREEIIAEHGDVVITRNSYGALCLNTPNVLFADVDFETGAPARWGCWIILALLIAAAIFGWWRGSWRVFALLAVAALLAGPALAALMHRAMVRRAGEPGEPARRRIETFAAEHPDWRLRVYRTPAGFRLLALHRTFAPTDPEASACFRALGTDRLYVTMCEKQHCFRARLTPKPWRIGVAVHLRPRPGVWPVRPEALPARREWVAAYDARADCYAACRFEMEYGQATVDPAAAIVQRIHDEVCRAQSNLPLA